MSEDVYHNMIRTESEGMERERVEMMVDIYESADDVSDHDFRTETQQPPQNTGSESAKTRSSRSTPVCLVLLCFLLLTAVIVLCVLIYTNNTNYTHERNQLLTRITNITEERDKLLTKNIKAANEIEQLLNLYQNVCKEGVLIFYKSSFYCMFSEMKNLTESRRDCKKIGADLIIINDKEEQDFVMRITHGKEVWIGLTDSEEEGRWKWVDGSELTSGFWGSNAQFKEPNGGTKENCVVTHLKRESDILGWLDVSCDGAYQWVCEKTIQPF